MYYDPYHVQRAVVMSSSSCLPDFLVSIVLIGYSLSHPLQHLVVLSFDGFLYMIDGATGCADSVDVGETSYSMVLADDLDGNGRMDLIVSTMNGNVYCFETPTPFHPLRTWPQQVSCECATLMHPMTMSRQVGFLAYP